MIPKSEKKTLRPFLRKAPLSIFGTPRHSIRSHRRSRITFFRFQRRTQKAFLFDLISGAEILSKPFRNPFKNPDKKKELLIHEKKIESPRNDSNMGAKDIVSIARFAASFPYRPEDWKSLENDVVEPPNQPQNVNECSTACQNHPPKTCETSPLPEPISTSSSTSSACLCPTSNVPNGGRAVFPPKRYSINWLSKQSIDWLIMN